MILGGGLALPAAANPSAQAMDAEQSHLQAVSAAYSVQVADDENLPLPLRSTERPKGQNLLKLSF